jgi:hypothetical protein
VLSIFEFDAYLFIDFITRILMNKFSGFETNFFVFFIYQNPRSRYMLELIVIFV